MKILLVIKDQDICNLLSFSLETRFAVQVQSCNSISVALEILRKDTPFQLIVLDCIETDFQLFFSYAKKVDFKTPLVLFENTATKTTGVSIAGQFQSSKLIEGLHQYLENIGTRIISNDFSEYRNLIPYCRIGSELLLKMSPLPIDIFIRLSEVKFLKIFNQGDAFNDEDLSKYKTKKHILYFYLKSGELAQVLENINAELLKILKSKEAITTAQSLRIVRSSFETAQDIIGQIGFTKEVQELVETSVEVTIKAVKEDPSLMNTMSSLEKDIDKYIAIHSVSVAHVACAIAKLLKWDNDVTFRKLTMAAFLHDITMHDQDLCAIRDLEELDKNRDKFNLQQIESYKKHPDKASTLVQGISKMPADVDKIILQHHEHPLGGGFPQFLNYSHIHPLASLFIIAHDLVDWTLRTPGAFNIHTFNSIYSEKYTMGNFKKIFRAIGDGTSVLGK